MHGSSVHAIANVSFVEFDKIKPLQQSFRQLSVRRPFQAIHLRVTTAATVYVLLIQLGMTAWIPQFISRSIEGSAYDSRVNIVWPRRTLQRQRYQTGCSLSWGGLDLSENKQEPGKEEREGSTELHCALGETTNVVEGVLAVERETVVATRRVLYRHRTSYSANHTTHCDGQDQSPCSCILLVQGRPC